MLICASATFWYTLLWMVHSHSFPKIQKLSPKYCTPPRKTTHQWRDDSFLLRLNTLLPLLKRESNLDFWGLHHFLVKAHFVIFFFFSPVFKPLQVQPESKVAEPACITLYQPAFDQSNQCRLPKGASDQQAQLLTAATIHTTAQCLPGKDKNAQSADKCSAAKSQVHHAFTRNME